MFVSGWAVRWPSLWVNCNKNSNFLVFLNFLQIKIFSCRDIFFLDKVKFSEIFPSPGQTSKPHRPVRKSAIVATASRSEIDRRFFGSFFTHVHFGDDLTKYQCTKNKNWNLHYKLFENIYALFMLLCPYEILLHI